MTRSVAAFFVLVLFGACSKAAPEPLVLDGRPRVPDAEGIVVAVSRTRLELDGGRKFELDSNLQSFSTQTMAAVPILQRKGQYVHVGADGKRARWVAAVGDVVRGPPDVVYFTGRLIARTEKRLTFADGTVLRLAPGVEGPAKGFVIATIDPQRHLVTAVSTP